MRALAAVLLALALAGCGVGAGDEPAGSRPVTVAITRDFGREQLDSVEVGSPAAGETVMRLLQRSFAVTTRYGGGFVQSIEGLSGGSSGARRSDWFFYVNGIESSEGAGAREVHPGDRIWWDHHEWSAAMRVPAVVGSFPEPFVSGAAGKRIPLRIDCASQTRRECDEVERRLVAAGAKAASQAGIGASAGIEILRVVVGPWEEVRRDPVASLLEKGPGASGVFARPGEDGIELLDADGRVVRTLTEAGGLIAATRFADQQPTWVVTGTDAAGVAAAASALEEGVLLNRFAVAVDEGRSLPLPVSEPPQAPEVVQP